MLAERIQDDDDDEGMLEEAGCRDFPEPLKNLFSRSQI